MNKFFKVPDSWRSTEWHNEQYLKSTAQAKMYSSQTHASKARDYSERLPSEPVADYEEPAPRQYSLQKKIGASILAAATLVMPSGQYAAAQHEQPSSANGDTMSLSEICYDSVEVAPATSDAKTFVISGAYNDALSEEGAQMTLAEFEHSPVLQDLQEYVDTLPGETNISAVEVHGTASDDNRSNIEAGIGKSDEINQRTAKSYASIATSAIKKLLGGHTKEVEFSQSAEEKMLTAEDQRAFDTIRKDTGMATNTDLLTAYNDVERALGGENRQILDEMINQHRGAEITVHTTTPEQSIVETECESVAMLSYDTPAGSAGVPYANPVAILPVWTRVTRGSARAKNKSKQDPYSRTFSERIKWRAELVADEIKHGLLEFKDSVQFIGNGVANAGREGTQETADYLHTAYNTWVVNEPARQATQHDMEYSRASYSRAVPKTRRERLLRPLRDAAVNIKDQVEHLETSTPGAMKQFIHRQNEQLLDTRQSIGESLRNIRTHHAKLNHLAKIPSADLQALDRNEFHAKHGVFLDEYYKARSTKKSLSLRRLLLQRFKLDN